MRGVALGQCCLILAFLVSGCSRDDIEKRIAGRWGPSPNIKTENVRPTLDEQFGVLDLIQKEAGLGNLDQNSDPRWFTVAQWGFNVGREDCMVYLNTVFKLQRERTRDHAIIGATQTATIGIVTAASPHAATALSVLGQAFGLATALNDAIYDSYLFTQAPGLISIKVKQLQDAYRNSKLPAHITSAPAAYSAIQDYYNICLPQSIEGVVLTKVAESQPEAKTKKPQSPPPKPKPPGPQTQSNTPPTPHARPDPKKDSNSLQQMAPAMSSTRMTSEQFLRLDSPPSRRPIAPVIQTTPTLQ
jgi:hypothetical protein